MRHRGLTALSASPAEGTERAIAASIGSRDSSLEALYVGLHRPRSDAADELAKDWRRLARKRREAGGRRLTVRFYDSATAEVWR